MRAIGQRGLRTDRPATGPLERSNVVRAVRRRASAQPAPLHRLWPKLAASHAGSPTPISASDPRPSLPARRRGPRRPWTGTTASPRLNRRMASGARRPRSPGRAIRRRRYGPGSRGSGFADAACHHSTRPDSHTAQAADSDSDTPRSMPRKHSPARCGRSSASQSSQPAGSTNGCEARKLSIFPRGSVCGGGPQTHPPSPRAPESCVCQIDPDDYPYPSETRDRRGRAILRPGSTPQRAQLRSPPLPPRATLRSVTYSTAIDSSVRFHIFSPS